jgi:FkbH-like protein
MKPLDLYWLPENPGFSESIRCLPQFAAAERWTKLCRIANSRIDFVATGRLDRAARAAFPEMPPSEAPIQEIRLAILSSSTADHLVSGIRVGGLRRGLWIDTYTCGFGQYRQELLDASSPLHAFRPTVILLALDAFHLFGGVDVATAQSDADEVVEQTAADISALWRLARERFGCSVIQQTLLPVMPRLLGNNEHRLHGSPRRMADMVNNRLRQLSDDAGTDMLDLDARLLQDGLWSWHDPMLWHRAKQEISPAASPLYGDLIARILAAKYGRSSKCLVLDLDNTLWGGVIGDDGLEGIVLGQGSAAGEAFLAFQAYVRALSQRGVILAVCSKNDELNALEAFERHPEMILRLENIACFVANWQDKAANVQEIARRLNIGVDSLVFVDDNPFERNIVRQELPTVAVPELPDDPALFAQSIADAGYFEALRVTNEDRERTRKYQDNAKRDRIKASATDIESFLKSLDMQFIWKRFDSVGMNRIVQLINKTNQFNLRTRRYTESEVTTVIENDRAICLQARLTDQFGDNGVVAIVIGEPMKNAHDMMLDTWLMSCRVLGRQVEQTTLNVIASEARRLGASRLIGEYRPTPKNNIVRDHYRNLGFQLLETRDDGGTVWALPLDEFKPLPTFAKVVEG